MTARVFLVLASCLVALGGCRATSARQSTEPSFTLKELAPNVWAAIFELQVQRTGPGEHGIRDR